jgi:hypothetical protein
MKAILSERSEHQLGVDKLAAKVLHELRSHAEWRCANCRFAISEFVADTGPGIFFNSWTYCNPTISAAGVDNGAPAA